MTDNLIVNGNLYERSNNVQELGKDSGGDVMPFYEEVTVTKTEVKEECYDFEMPVNDIAFVNVNEEYVSSLENNIKNETLGHWNSTEQPLHENVDFGNCDSQETNLQENKYRCELCHSDFDNEIHLRCHYEHCPYAKKKLSKKGEDTDEKYKCAHCMFSTSVKLNYIRHGRIHAKSKSLHKCIYKDCTCTPEQKDFCGCNPCGYAGTSKYVLDRHILIRHSVEPKKYNCNNCKYATNWKPTLIEHLRIHTNDRPFKCTYKNCKCTPEQKESCECNMCGYSAKYKQALQKHVLFRHNTESKKYKCSDCKYATNIKPSLLQHICTHTNERPFKCTYKNCKCTLEQKELCECNPCAFRSINKSYLNQHILMKHSAKPKRYKCKDCMYAAHLKISLIQHMRIHNNDKPFKCTYKHYKCTCEQKESCECDMCGYATHRKQALQSHVLVKHSTESKKYKCSDCKYATHVKMALLQHIRTHTNERPFKCTYKNCKCTPEQKELCKCNPCGYEASRKSALSQHVLVKHSGEPAKYKCKDCEFATHTKTVLTRHMRMHTNDRPFKCTYKNCKCTNEQKESCKCDMCGYATTLKYNLQKHVLARHSSELKKYRCNDSKFSPRKKKKI